MIVTTQIWMYWCGIAVTASAAVYTVAAAISGRLKLSSDYQVRPGEAPAVTILKPLCGDEHELYECLRSFCDQDCAKFQIVFGVADGDDPDAEVVIRLFHKFLRPHLKLQVDRRR